VGAKYLYEGSEGNSLTVAWNEHILYIYLIYLFIIIIVTRVHVCAHVKHLTVNKREKKFLNQILIVLRNINFKTVSSLNGAIDTTR
jgi:hypothetical protein